MPILLRYLPIIWLYAMISLMLTSAAEPPQNKPHIIMILADDLGFNDVPWHNEEVIAPNLQRLVDGGIILNQSYVLPRCTPTRSAILSGMYPFTIGRQEGVLDQLQPTGLTLGVSLIPEYLKPFGYETHAIGKWHLGFCKWEYTPTERGFDSFRGFYNGAEDYFTHRHGLYDYVHRVSRFGYDFRHNRTVDDEAFGDYSTYQFASHVETILHSGDPEVPKFLYVAFQSVHAPLQVPEIYIKPYEHIEDTNRRIYLGMVSAMDEAIGRIITALKETGHYDNSVIVFSTDNGGAKKTGASNLPLRGMKGTLWEGGTRGVAFIHSQLLPNSTPVVNNLIFATDWLATFIKIAGGEPPKGTDSISHWEALRGEAPPPREELVYNIVSTESALAAAIRVGDYKLLVGNPGKSGRSRSSRLEMISEFTNPMRKRKRRKDRNQSSFSFNSVKDIIEHDIPLRLYDLKSDPEERKNLASFENETTIFLLERLLSYKSRYVLPDNPEEDPTGDPQLWDGVWSPGWC